MVQNLMRATHVGIKTSSIRLGWP